MRLDFYITALASCLVVVAAGSFLVPGLFYGRILPGVAVSQLWLAGATASDAPLLVAAYGEAMVQKPMAMVLRGATQRLNLEALGVQLDVASTVRAAFAVRWLAVLGGQRNVGRFLGRSAPSG